MDENGDAVQGFHKLDWGTSLNKGAADAMYTLTCHLDGGYTRLDAYRIDEP